MHVKKSAVSQELRFALLLHGGFRDAPTFGKYEKWKIVERDHEAEKRKQQVVWNEL